MYKVSTDRFEPVANCMEDIKFLHALPRGSDEYSTVLSKYMKEREERKKRKRSAEDGG